MTLAELVYGFLDIRERQKENEVWARCPFCDDTQYRLGINVQTGQAQCFRGSCGFKTSSKPYLFNRLVKLFKITNAHLTDYVPEKKEETAKAKIEPFVMPKEFEPLWQDVNDEIGRKALDYLLSRGIPLRQIKQHGIGFCAVGQYAYRIIFPVYRKERIVGIVGRDFTGQSSLRYLNSEGIKYFYNVPRKKKDKAVLSEGPVDALAIERAFDSDALVDSLGKLGTGLTEIQQKILKRYKEIILWPDPDNAGISWTLEVAKFCRDYAIPVSIIIPERDDVDPGKLGESISGLKEIRRRILRRRMWTAEIPMILRAKVLFQE